MSPPSAPETSWLTADGEIVVEGTIQGKKGTFALRSTGIYTGGVDNTLTVVEGSAT